MWCAIRGNSWHQAAAPLEAQTQWIDAGSSDDGWEPCSKNTAARRCVQQPCLSQRTTVRRGLVLEIEIAVAVQIGMFPGRLPRVNRQPPPVRIRGLHIEPKPSIVGHA